MYIDIESIIKEAINLNQQYNTLMILWGEANPSKEADELQDAAEKINDTKHNLWRIVEDGFRFSHHDFLGDGHLMFVDNCLSGDLTPKQVIEEILNLDLIGQREWIIETYLQYFIESSKEMNNYDKEAKQHGEAWFNGTLKKIETKTGFDQERMEELKSHLPLFIKGDIPFEAMMLLFDDYILEGNVNKNVRGTNSNGGKIAALAKRLFETKTDEKLIASLAGEEMSIPKEIGDKFIEAIKGLINNTKK